MSTYNNNRFTPGNKANMRSFIQKHKKTYHKYYINIKKNLIDHC